MFRQDRTNVIGVRLSVMAPTNCMLLFIVIACCVDFYTLFALQINLTLNCVALYYVSGVPGQLRASSCLLRGGEIAVSLHGGFRLGICVTSLPWCCGVLHYY